MAKPIVNGIEKDLDGKSEVIRIDMLSSIGNELATGYGVTVVPTTLVLNGRGDVIYRHSGLPDRNQVVAAASA